MNLSPLRETYLKPERERIEKFIKLAYHPYPNEMMYLNRTTNTSHIMTTQRT
jgi:hypothetical protein